MRVADLDSWPYLIFDAGRAAGVIALVDERQLSGEIALFHLLIDADQQRRGYGRAAVRGVVQLSVNWMVATVCDSPSTLRTTLRSIYQSEGFIVHFGPLSFGR